MDNSNLFDEAIERIDAANREDPRIEIFDGQPHPRELLFAQRVYEWVGRLAHDPSKELLLAARAHTLRRWRIPRDQYATTTLGYHQWRDALAAFHANEAESILVSVGFSEERVLKIKALITKKLWPADEEACVLEDADCLVFLETKLQNYMDTWEESKALRILVRTLRKMTPAGRAHAGELKLGAGEQALVRRAMDSFNAESNSGGTGGP